MTALAINQLNVTQQNMLVANDLSFNQQAHRWHYLLSNELTFSRGQHAIRINKPQADLVYSWVMKLIIGGQASAIYIEEHQFRVEEIKALQIAAEKHQVSIYHLHLTQQENVLKGPW